ncbi:hypothetical protein U9M48_007706 [Paspalum notatum var. saurae]|uniref:Uncharacterized protein n=1 Tax=Paspalum notatum var. saurae TaxID=547442 RepID=A0AAQ3SMZ7_PASNO
MTSHQGHRQAKTFSGLRAVHTPAPTPVAVLGNSTSRSSRGPEKKNTGGVPRAATLDGFTGEIQSMVAVAQRAFRGSSSSGGERGIGGLVARARLDGLVQQVLGLFALANYQIQCLRWHLLPSADVLMCQVTQLAILFLLEHIFRQGFTAISFGMWGSPLNKCGTDVTKLAREGKFDPVIGREKQIDQVVQILSRRSKNNPCLIGDPGVGKTAIVEGLAQLIVKGEVPETIKGKKVISIDMAGFLDGQVYRGQFEARIKNLLREVKQSGKIILFIDEVHTLVGAGRCREGGVDAANVFKPALARGELQIIGATTTDEYKKYIEKDAALERRFRPIKVLEPTVDETIGILRGLRERYEKHHKVQYTDDALSAAAELSHKYIRSMPELRHGSNNYEYIFKLTDDPMVVDIIVPRFVEHKTDSDRFLPDKAIDLIDQAGPLVSLRHAKEKPSKGVQDLEAELDRIIKEKKDEVSRESYKRAKELHDHELELKSLISKSKESKMATDELRKKQNPAGVSARPVVTEEDIRHVVSSWTGVPVQKLAADETNRLLNMEETLHKRVVGQDEAVTAISRAIRRARAGLSEPGRPVGSFLFAGPTGVGKTELAKAVAAFYYGSEAAMVRLDMSEFTERHTVSRLVGTPPGYVQHADGGQLTEAVRQRPHTLVLFDEIEKAHPDVFDVMLQILDDGRLTDGKGRTVNFKNTLIVMTSNIGGSLVVANGHGAGVGYDRIKDLVVEEMKRHFRPEFLNRLDETIVFRQLSKAQIKEIAGIMLNDVAARVRKKGVELQVTERFVELVVEEGFDMSYGVRPLKRAIVRLLGDALAEKMLAGEIKDGDSVAVDTDLAGNVVFRVSDSKQLRVCVQRWNALMLCPLGPEPQTALEKLQFALK